MGGALQSRSVTAAERQSGKDRMASRIALPSSPAKEGRGGYPSVNPGSMVGILDIGQTATPIRSTVRVARDPLGAEPHRWPTTPLDVALGPAGAKCNRSAA